MTLDGSRVQRHLEKVGKSKEWLAGQLNCSVKTVEGLLGGRIPRGATLVELAKLMGCQVEDLVTQQASKRPA